MSDIAIEVNHVWKKFRRGEFHDSLRDLVPVLVRRLVNGGPKASKLGENEFWALKDISFQVRRGEAVGIIGPNGAGKSTLLKILSGILRPNCGRYEVHGKVRALIEVGAGFHQDLTGRENVYLNGAILGMAKAEIDGKLDEIIDFSGIEPFIDTPIKRYSSGMRARLGFSIMAHLEPEVLLVDEVLSVGDAAFQKKCLGKMNEVARYGRTVLFVSHNLSAIRQLCSETVVLTNGCIMFRGESNAAVMHYLAHAEQRSIFISRDPVGTRFISQARLVKADGYAEVINRGDDLCIEILVMNGDEAFDVALGISIETQEMIRVITDLTLNRDQPLSCPSGLNTYRFRIPSLPLSQGTYFVTVAVHDWKNGSTVDRRDHCFYFDVVEPSYEHGIAQSRGQRGLVVCQCHWERIPTP